MRILFALTIAMILLACGPSLKQKAEGSDVVKEPVFSQSYLDSMDRVKALEDSLYFSGPTVAIVTTKGTMTFKLYNKTPLHRDNFIKLAKAGFYKDHKFHRIMKGFMVQTGDPNSKDNNPRDDGLGGPGYTIPAEFQPRLIHRRGALAAAREGDEINPKQASSGSQFYIVDGQQYKLNDPIFANFNTPSEDRQVYSTVGGTPMLDRAYTVFGEILSGYDVMESIAGSKVEENPFSGELSKPVEYVKIISVDMLQDSGADTPKVK